MAATFWTYVVRLALFAFSLLPSLSVAGGPSGAGAGLDEKSATSDTSLNIGSSHDCHMHIVTHVVRVYESRELNVAAAAWLGLGLRLGLGLGLGLVRVRVG